MKKNLLLFLLCTVTIICFTGCGNEEEIDFQDMIKGKCIEKMEDVRKIEIFDYKNKKTKSITLEEKIDEINNIIFNTNEVTGDVNLEGHTWHIYMYNENDELVCNAYAWESGYLGFSEKIKKEYEIESDDINRFEKLIEP